jgi:hypothetical protein
MRHGFYVAAIVGCVAVLPPMPAGPAPFERPARSSPKAAAARKDWRQLQGAWYTVSTA